MIPQTTPSTSRLPLFKPKSPVSVIQGKEMNFFGGDFVLVSPSSLEDLCLQITSSTTTTTTPSLSIGLAHRKSLGMKRMSYDVEEEENESSTTAAAYLSPRKRARFTTDGNETFQFHHPDSLSILNEVPLTPRSPNPTCIEVDLGSVPKVGRHPSDFSYLDVHDEDFLRKSALSLPTLD